MIYYSELCCLNQPLVKMLDTMEEYGGDRIELMMDGQYWDCFEQRGPELLQTLKSRNNRYSVHPAAWDMNLTSESNGIRAATYAHYESCIRFAHDLGADQVVIHPGFSLFPFSKALAKQRAMEAIERLSVVAKPLGVKLALENVGNVHSMIYSQDEFARLADGLEDHVGLLLDIGHAHVTGFDIPSLIRSMGDRLLSVHLHDNNGIEDQHLHMGDGTVRFEPIFDALRPLWGRCRIVLEYKCTVDLQYLRLDKERIQRIME